MKIVKFSQAREKFKDYCVEAIETDAELCITTIHGNVILMSVQKYSDLVEKLNLKNEKEEFEHYMGINLTDLKYIDIKNKIKEISKNKDNLVKALKERRIIKNKDKIEYILTEGERFELSRQH